VSQDGDKGRFLALISHDIGWDIDGLTKAMGSIPARIFKLKEEIQPLKTERQMLASRYSSKGTQPSRYDNRRKYILAELKEEVRTLYYRNPDYTEPDAKGNKRRIEMTDGRAEDRAHGHPRYLRLLEEADEDAKRIAELNKEISVRYDKVEALEGRRTYLQIRLEIVKGLAFAWGNEAKLTP
jgi:chromosome segregation ATPase